MISFSVYDIIALTIFFLFLITIGFYFGRNSKNDVEDFFLSSRQVGLVMFVMTNVATWYGGILGVGEFVFRYGLLSWTTQGLPYYIFALGFAFLFAKKIREKNIATLPDKIFFTYGQSTAAISGFFIFVLTLPAPYLLMTAYLFETIFGLNYFAALLLAAIVSSVYIIKGGYRADLYTDVFLFIVMFVGFGIGAFIVANNFGGLDFLMNHLPDSHLRFDGGASPTYILAWFLIALWTFVDPGFYQRVSSAKNSKIAFWGIVISIFFWFLFDFLTTTFGLYSKAVLQDLPNPVLSFPILADRVLSPGIKGIFFAAMFATIISTLNSFLILSGAAFSKDFIQRLYPKEIEKIESKTNFISIGIISSLLISIIFCLIAKSVVEIWYIIGSVCVPGLLFVTLGSFYDVFKGDQKYANKMLIVSFIFSLGWFILRNIFTEIELLNTIEPMLVGLSVSFTILLINKFLN